MVPQNFRYAALSGGSTCRCGLRFGRHGQARDEDCNVLCKGVSTAKCGGHNFITVLEAIGLDKIYGKYLFFNFDKASISLKENNAKLPQVRKKSGKI